MIGILLLTIRPLPTGIWRWCSGFAFVVTLLFAITMTKRFRRLDLRQIQSRRGTRLVFYLFGTLGIAVNLLQLYNVAVLGAFWAFFSSIVVQLLTGVFQFARMILLRHE